MTNPIDQVFARSQSIRLMTHVVAGYPDLKTTEQLILEMARQGVDLIEMQIPFSDPLADGPTIMKACQQALDQGTTPADCFQLAQKISPQISCPLLLMTYINIPFRLGFESFIDQCVKAGIAGIIIPDLPVDSQDSALWELAAARNVYPIPVVSPDVFPARLAHVVSFGRGFIYSTLKVGITGASTTISPQGLQFLHAIRQHSPLPIAAGFGISSAEQVRQLEGHADAAIIGSHLINLFNQSGLPAVSAFLRSCRS